MERVGFLSGWGIAPMETVRKKWLVCSDVGLSEHLLFSLNVLSTVT